MTRRLAEAPDSMAKASTPEPFSTSKTSNWVARAGGLPAYIQHVAHDLVDSGHSESNAIGMAIGIIKNWAHGHNGKFGKVHPDTMAAAQKALAEWEALKGKNAAKKVAEGIRATPDEIAAMSEKWGARLALLEGVRASLADDPRNLALAAAQKALGGAGRSFNLAEAAAPADHAEVARVLDPLNREIAELRPFVSGLELTEAPRGKKAMAKAAPPAKEEPDQLGERTGHLQRRLTSLGFDTKDDGKFGIETRRQVKAFQHHAKLKEDGLVGPKTTQALQAAPTPEAMADADDEGANLATPETATPDSAAKKAAEPEVTSEPSSGTADPQAASPETPVGDQPGGVSPAPAPKPKGKPDNVLYKGMGVGEGKGKPEVTELQLGLEDLGYPNIAVDGRFGPKTEQTVKRFQSKMGLKSDGIVGEKTKRTMANLTKSKADAIQEAEAATTASEVIRARARLAVIRRRIQEGTVQEADSKADTPGMQGGGDMKRCPSCGWRNKVGTATCKKCGAKLRKDGDAKIESKS